MRILGYGLKQVREEEITIVGGQIVQVLSVQADVFGHVLLALVLQDGVNTKRKIKMYNTGEEVDPGFEYIGTVRMKGYESNPYYCHYFMEREQVDEPQTL